VRGVSRNWLRRLYSFAVEPTLAFYFDVPLDEAVRRIMVGRPAFKYYEAGLDLALSPDPAVSFRTFQSLIRAEYDQVVDEFGLIRIDATSRLVAQQQHMRELVRPYLDGAVRAPQTSLGEPLHVVGLPRHHLAERRLEAAR